MELFLQTSDVDIAILLEKYKRLMAREGVSVTWKFSHRMVDESFPDVESPFNGQKHGITLFLPEKSKEPFSNGLVPKVKPLKVDECSKIRFDQNYDDYIANFYYRNNKHFYPDEENRYEIESEEPQAYLARHNAADWIGKLCARMYIDFEHEHLFQDLHKKLLLLSKTLIQHLGTHIEYVFPPMSRMILDLFMWFNRDDYEGTQVYYDH